MKKEKLEDVHHYRSITRNLLLTVILVSLAPLLIVSGTILYHFHVSYRQKAIAHLEEMVEKHRQNIDSFLNEKLADIRVMGESFTFEQLSNESFLWQRLSIRQREHGGVFVDMGLVNDQGVQVAYAGTFKLGHAVYSEADWFKKAMASQYFISDVFLGLRGLPHFIVATKEDWQGRSWILRATINFVAFNSLVENIHIGETGMAFILNRKGEFQTNPRADVTLHMDIYKDLLTRNITKVSVVEKADGSGAKFIYLLAPLKKGDWILVYQQDARDAFSVVYKTQKLALIILLVGGLGIVIMAFVLSKRMVNRIIRADREKEMMSEQVIEAGKMASLGELAAGIAHEINNPVAIMVEEAGWLEDLLGDGEIQQSEVTENIEEFKRALQQIKNQGIRCKGITHKLLSFARKTDAEVHDVQLNDLITEVVGISEQMARYSNVKIQMHLAGDLPTVTVSPSEIQQVFLNLINNSIDAMDKDGGRIDITSRVDGNFVVIDVADTGQGIPKLILSRIFDPFFTTKPVGKGTGLGLSIVYGIVEKMGGEISVNSAVGMGTTFHIRIPHRKS
ncbi:MAG: ATP-binding protein [Syntrophales bacterium]